MAEGGRVESPGDLKTTDNKANAKIQLLLSKLKGAMVQGVHYNDYLGLRYEGLGNINTVVYYRYCRFAVVGAAVVRFAFAAGAEFAGVWFAFAAGAVFAGARVALAAGAVFAGCSVLLLVSLCRLLLL